MYTQMYPRCCVGVPGLAACTNGQGCGGLHDVFVCVLVCKGPLRRSCGGVGELGGGGHDDTATYRISYPMQTSDSLAAENLNVNC